MALVGSATAAMLAGCSSSGSPASSSSGSSALSGSSSSAGPSTGTSAAPPGTIQVDLDVFRRAPLPSKGTVVYVRGTSAPLDVGTVAGYLPGSGKYVRLRLRLTPGARVPAGVDASICQDVVALVLPPTAAGPPFLVDGSTIPLDRTLIGTGNCDHRGGA